MVWRIGSCWYCYRLSVILGNRRPLYMALTLLFLGGCNANRSVLSDVGAEEPKQKRILEFDRVLSEAKLRGAILFLDPVANTLYSNDFVWASTARLPASTFKVPNSIIALETGLAENEESILEWDGRPMDQKIWERDLTLKQAFHLSCVPCYQKIARAIGVKRMKHYTRKFDYGSLDIHKQNIDKFWLEGESKISPLQQIGFLRRFNEKRLSVSDKTYGTMKRMMVMDTVSGYVLRGKTGWAVRNGNDYGWFVGYLQKGNSTLYFAVNVEPYNGLETGEFLKGRKRVMLGALVVLKQKEYI